MKKKRFTMNFFTRDYQNCVHCAKPVANKTYHQHLDRVHGLAAESNTIDVESDLLNTFESQVSKVTLNYD